MPALITTGIHADVVWLGIVGGADRKELLASPRQAVEVGFDGITGSHHAGDTRPACARVSHLHDPGTPIRNERQLSIVAEEELAVIAERLGVLDVSPARLGATIMLRGIPDFTHIPPSSRLQAPSGATLVVDMANHPCQFPALSLARVHGDAARGFVAAARGLRGVTAWVAAEGTIALGDRLRLFVPGQRGWKAFAASVKSPSYEGSA